MKKFIAIILIFTMALPLCVFGEEYENKADFAIVTPSSISPTYPLQLMV